MTLSGIISTKTSKSPESREVQGSPGWTSTRNIARTFWEFENCWTGPVRTLTNTIITIKGFNSIDSNSIAHIKSISKRIQVLFEDKQWMCSIEKSQKCDFYHLYYYDPYSYPKSALIRFLWYKILFSFFDFLEKYPEFPIVSSIHLIAHIKSYSKQYLKIFKSLKITVWG